MVQEKSKKISKDDGIKFLLTEYSECFDQIRHYEGVADTYLKYATAGYPIIIGGISALYTILGADYRNIVVSALLFLTFSAGFAVFRLLLANRSYYVIVARQINSIRRYFVKNAQELEFDDYNRAYIDNNKPDAYSPSSSSARFFDIISILNSLAGAGCIYFFSYHFEVNSGLIWIAPGVILVALFLWQRIWGIRYLKRKDKLLREQIK